MASYLFFFMVWTDLTLLGLIIVVVVVVSAAKTPLLFDRKALMT